MNWALPGAILFLLALVLLLGYFLSRKVFSSQEKGDRGEDFSQRSPCDGCDQAGCGGFARALVRGGPEDPAFGTETGKGLTCERGSERAPARQPDEVKAAVLCTGSRVPLRYRYSGAPSCQAAARMAVSPKECANACLGFGDCCRACRTTGAIRVEGGLARVDSSRCNGCGECLGSCPLDLIGLIRVERGLLVLCKGPEGPTSEWSCPDGCTLCGRCIDACQEGAFRRTGSGFPEWLAERCNGCGLCVEACPQGVVLLCGANDQAASFAFAGRGTSSRQ